MSRLEEGRRRNRDSGLSRRLVISVGANFRNDEQKNDLVNLASQQSCDDNLEISERERRVRRETNGLFACCGDGFDRSYNSIKGKHE
jgi:hypothetical protein